MRLGLLVAADIFRRHTIVGQEAADDVAHMVAAHFGHHGAGHASASQRHDAVEGRAARNGFLRLVVLEQDIQHGLAYAYYAFLGHATHVFFLSYGCKDTKNAVFLLWVNEYRFFENISYFWPLKVHQKQSK